MTETNDLVEAAKLKIYISGKISGLDYQEALKLFAEASRRISLAGCEAVNPMDMIPTQVGKTWEQYMCEDIALIFECDGVYLLNNWQESRGARIEKAICEILDKRIFYADCRPTTRRPC